jgi:hypothetical protein
MPTIEILLPSDRNRAGQLFLKDDAGHSLLGPYAACGRANDFAASEHGNPTRSPLLPYGDTPTGEYRVRGIVPTGGEMGYDESKFGRSGMIVLEPVSGQALLADRNGRHVLVIHAGTPNARSRLLYATNGSVRMYDGELRELVEAVRGDSSVTCRIRETSEIAASFAVTLDPAYDEGDPPLAADQVMAGGAKLVVCATSHTAGVRHRYRVMRQVKSFADRFGYSVRMLWGVTSGVSYCRHEELFKAVPGVAIDNLSAEELLCIMRQAMAGGTVRYRGEALRVLRPGESLVDRFLSWDCPMAEALGELVPGGTFPIDATPSPALQSQVDVYLRANRIQERLGIRVRVTENPKEGRKPHRVKAELDATLESVSRIPRETPVFIATDSEYIQEGLLSHFIDTRFFPKRFEKSEQTGGYVLRTDKDAMLTFLKEVSCLCACRRIIDIGGFLNEASVRSKIIRAPYDKATFLTLTPVKDLSPMVAAP